MEEIYNNQINTIFNPKDKLNERNEKKYFIDLMPYEKAYIARENGFKYDKIFKKWFTYDADHDLLKEFKRKDIDFYKFKKDNSLYYDNETKKWYTYANNETFKNY